MCGQSFTNLAQEINVLYSIEQKERPLGSQALAPAPLTSPMAGWPENFLWGYD